MYGTVERADVYVKAHYTSKSDERVRWLALSDEDKAAYMEQAFDLIERLPFRGRKASPDQGTAFPRLPYQYGAVEAGAPTEVVNAETELAVYLSDTGTQESSKKRKQLIKDGVKSFSLGDLSESYGSATSDTTSDSRSDAYNCRKAMMLLSPYLSGGFDIC